jgi:hypothetical protein
VPEDIISAESSNIENGKDNTTQLNQNDTTNSKDEFDWDFILDREWSRTKK